MKKILILLSLQLLFTSTYSQTLTVEQVSKVFDSWMKTKGASRKSITVQLKALNPSWALQSETPTIEDYNKSYIWTAPTEMGEPQYFALDVEEDEESFKYSVRYLFYHYAKFLDMVELLKQSNPGKFSESRNAVKDKYSLLVNGSTLDRFLFAENIDTESGKTVRGFKFEIVSRYIDKK
jgi:hypothetical protein